MSPESKLESIPTPETQTNYPELEQWLELELKKQYQEQIEIYRQNNLIELNPELKQMGIYGINHSKRNRITPAKPVSNNWRQS